MLVSDTGRCFAFTKQELMVLTSVMATDDSRGLAALWLHGSRAAAWATDGRRAVMVERQLPPPKASKDGPVAIPASAAHHAARAAKRRDLLVIDLLGVRVSIDVREPLSPGVEIDSYSQIDTRTRSKHLAACDRHDAKAAGQIDQFFPLHHDRGAKGATVPINPALLAPVVLLGKVAAGSYVWINIGEPEEPVTFVAESEDDPLTRWRMLLLPLRGATDEHPDHDARKVGSTTTEARAAS